MLDVMSSYVYNQRYKAYFIVIGKKKHVLAGVLPFTIILFFESVQNRNVYINDLFTGRLCDLLCCRVAYIATSNLVLKLMQR